MAGEKKNNRRAASTYIEPGEHSIDRCTPNTLKREGKPAVTKAGKPILVMTWHVRLHDGRLLQKQTQGPNNAAIRRKAKRTADAMLRAGGHAPWTGREPIERYLDEVVAPAIEDAGRPKTVLAYRRSLKLIRAQLVGHTISSAWHYDVLKAVLKTIAKEQGAETARQARIVISKHISEHMRSHRLITDNPIAGSQLDLKKGAKPVTRPQTSGLGLTADEQERVITWLLNLDPADGLVAPKRGRWTLQHRIDRQRKAIDLTLFQAGTGLRINEALQVTHSLLVTDKDGTLRVNVTKEIAKTGIARLVPVLDPRIEARLRELMATAPSPDAFLTPSSTGPTKQWTQAGKSSASDTVAGLYTRMAHELDIPLLENARTHLWRTTLSSRLAEAGVPREDYAATLGHDSATNEKYYTDRTDISALLSVYRKYHG